MKSKKIVRVNVDDVQYTLSELYHLDVDVSTFYSLELQCEVFLEGNIVTILQKEVGEQYTYFTVPVTLTYTPTALYDDCETANSEDFINKMQEECSRGAFCTVNRIKCYHFASELNLGYSDQRCVIKTTGEFSRALKEHVFKLLNDTGILHDIIKEYAEQIDQ